LFCSDLDRPGGDGFLYRVKKNAMNDSRERFSTERPHIAPVAMLTEMQNRRQGPIAEFRRWLIMAFVFSILGGSFNLILPKMNIGQDVWKVAVLLLVYWLMFSASEGWIQFKNTARRILWPVAGGLSFAGMLLLDEKRISWVHLVYLIPAGIEFLVARGARSRPWIWLIATPLFYGSVEAWGDRLRSAVGDVIQWTWSSLDQPLAIQSDVPEAAAGIGALLIARAVVGSFIASKKEP